ncbi:MAG: MFS transporter, partial [Spongiibacter sp.]|nr:MFS transporter [Spongiibacter sp.]
AGLAGLLWLACTVGMVLPVQNISVTLSWPQGGWGYERLRNEVLCLPGTLDVTVFEDERQAYLRVSKGFDLAQLPAELYRRD